MPREAYHFLWGTLDKMDGRYSLEKGPRTSRTARASIPFLEGRSQKIRESC